MEIVVLSGLALLGYELSKNNKQPRNHAKVVKKTNTESKRCNKYPFDDKKVSHTSFLNENKPFFTERKVSTNDTQKQRRMESFTGADTEIYWQKKQEVENMFKPQKDLTNIHGSASQKETYRTDRYSGSLTQTMKGVAPTEKIQVGRGLNKGSGVSASGGFHDSLRIIPENINGYKKNSFAGRTLAGKGVNNMRDATPSIENNDKPNRFYTDNDRQIAPTKSNVNKQQNRGEIILQCTTREQCNEMVHLGAAASDNLAPTNRLNGTRDYDSSKCSLSGNPHMQVLGNNAQYGSYVMPEGERENCGSVTNAYNGNGSTKRYIDGANPTLREDQNDYQGQAHNSQVNAGGHLSNKYTVNPTMRGDQNNYQGQAYNKYNNASGHTQTNYTAQPTVREEIGQNSYENAPTYNNGQSTRKYQANPTQRQSTHSDYTGVANSHHKGNQDQYSMRTAQPFKKREDVQQEFIPSGSRMNLREDAVTINGAVQLQSDCNSHPTNHGIHNQASSVNQLGNIEHANKCNSVNTRNDFNLAKDILKNNQYSHSIA